LITSDDICTFVAIYCRRRRNDWTEMQFAGIRPYDQR